MLSCACTIASSSLEATCASTVKAYSMLRDRPRSIKAADVRCAVHVVELTKRRSRSVALGRAGEDAPAEYRRMNVLNALNAGSSTTDPTVIKRLRLPVEHGAAHLRERIRAELAPS
jgi:hypothetical protein